MPSPQDALIDDYLFCAEPHSSLIGGWAHKLQIIMSQWPFKNRNPPRRPISYSFATTGQRMLRVRMKPSLKNRSTSQIQTSTNPQLMTFSSFTRATIIRAYPTRRFPMLVDGSVQALQPGGLRLVKRSISAIIQISKAGLGMSVMKPSIFRALAWHVCLALPTT
jgi:hypothetical protein